MENGKSEEWAPVIGYENLYEVSSIGRVKSLDRVIRGRWGDHHVSGKLRALSTDKYGYIRVDLWMDGKYKLCQVHRLVALAFIKAETNKPHVNHINGIKSDNRAENLEWCTPSENELHSFRVLGKKNSTPSKEIVGIRGNEKIDFASATMAGRRGFHQPSIVSCLKGRLKTHKGYSWSYVNVES